MERELESGRKMPIPRILQSLVAVFKKLEGHKSEGIFRVPADAEGVSGIVILI
jgi:hypothetical protein